MWHLAADAQHLVAHSDKEHRFALPAALASLAVEGAHLFTHCADLSLAANLRAMAALAFGV